MSWLSNLPPTGRNPQRRASNDDRGRTQSGKGRRRIMSLESLENRTVLSNVTASLAVSGALTITGDTHNDSFSITENAAGTVTVAATSFQTTIDLTHLPYNTPSKVTSIVVILPGTTNFDTVAINGPGKTTATPVHTVAITATGANLTFTGNGIDNSGSLTLSDTVGLPGGNDAALHASVDNSTFASLTITQTGNTLAYVELGNDNINSSTGPGPVTVSEGVDNADKIILDKLAGGGDTFGVTTLSQGTGPAFAGGNGSADSVSVSNASVADLTIKQILNGNDASISVNILSVAQADVGVVTSQGNGNGDTTKITGVTAPIPTTAIGPPTPASILVTQGNGNGDSASVTNSKLPGNITINQGNGNGDSATISGVTVGFKVTSGGTTKAYYGNLTISRGTGKGNTASVTDSIYTGKITITP
jgi:hypothetical protein